MDEFDPTTWLKSVSATPATAASAPAAEAEWSPDQWIQTVSTPLALKRLEWAEAFPNDPMKRAQAEMEWMATRNEEQIRAEQDRRKAAHDRALALRGYAEAITGNESESLVWAYRAARELAPSEYPVLLDAVRRRAAEKGISRSRGTVGAAGQALLLGAASTGTKLQELTGLGGVAGHLTDEQRTFAQTLLAARRQADPLTSAEQPFYRRWVPQAAEMAYPMFTGAAMLVSGPWGGVPAAAFWAGITYPDRYQEYRSAGLPTNQAKVAAATSAVIEGAIETIGTFPFIAPQSKTVIKGTVGRALRQAAKEIATSYSKELSEETLQAAVSETTKAVATRLSDEAPDSALPDIFTRAVKETVEAAGPLLVLAAPGGAMHTLRSTGRTLAVQDAVRHQSIQAEAEAFARRNPDAARQWVQQMSNKPDGPSRDDVPGLTRKQDRIAFLQGLQRAVNQPRPLAEVVTGVPEKLTIEEQAPSPAKTPRTPQGAQNTVGEGALPQETINAQAVREDARRVQEAGIVGHGGQEEGRPDVQRQTQARTETREPEASQQITRPYGRPDLANPAVTPEARAAVDDVDEMRNRAGQPGVRPRLLAEEEALQRVAADYEGELAALLKKGTAGEALATDTDTSVAHEIVRREWATAASSADPDKLARAIAVTNAYRETGTAQARSFGNRFDRIMNPAERLQAQLREVLATPTDVQLKRIQAARKAQDASAERKVYEDIAKDIADIRQELSKIGVSLDELLAERRPKRLATAAAQARQELHAEIGRFAQLIGARTGASLGFTPDPEIVAQAGNIVAKAVKAGIYTFAELIDQLADQIGEMAVRRFGPTLSAAWTQAAQHDTKLQPEANLEEGLRLRRSRMYDLLRSMDHSRQIKASKSGGLASFGDKLFEWHRSALLSGLQTWGFAGVNVIGNTAQAVIALPERFLAALWNLVIRDPNSAQLGEFKYLFHGMARPLATSFEMMRAGWETEANAWEAVLGRTDEDKWDRPNIAIRGAKGRLIRIGQRGLRAHDQFHKSLITQAFVGPHAYRLAKAKGLQGMDLAREIDRQVYDIHSEAWTRAIQDAQYLTTEQSVESYDPATRRGRIAAGVVGPALSLRRTIPLTRHVLPFVTFPALSAEQVIKRSWLGILRIPPSVVRATRTGDWRGIPTMLAQQTIAWAVIAAIALWNDQDDPWITGYEKSSGISPESRGAQQAAQRARPPTSVRLFGQWINYNRVQPVGGALALAVTFIDTVKSYARTGRGEDVALKQFKALTGTLVDQTTLQGVSDILDAMADPETAGAYWIRNFIIGMTVPNIFRATARARFDVVPEQRLWGHDLATFGKRIVHGTQLPIIEYQPKYDLWGRPIEATHIMPRTSAVGRLINIAWRAGVAINVRTADVHPGDRVLFAYNMDKPLNEQLWPDMPRPTLTTGDVTDYMTDAEFAQFSYMAGQRASERVTKAIEAGRIDAEKPTKRQVEFIIEIIHKARDRARKEIMRERRAKVPHDQQQQQR
ncbi:MAG: hypothetical protein AB1508_18930 [Pseudomonadota bacterium]